MRVLRVNLRQGDFARSRGLAIENKAERLPYQPEAQTWGISEFTLDNSDKIWIYSGCSIVADRAFSAGVTAEHLWNHRQNNISLSLFFFLGVLCLVHLTIANHHSLIFNRQEIQLVITSCSRNVSSCCHLKGTARTEDCEGKAEILSQVPTGWHRDLNLLAKAAEPTVFGDMAEQGYSSWWVRTGVALPISSYLLACC